MGKSVREWFDADEARLATLASIVPGLNDTEAAWRVVSYAIAGALALPRRCGMD